MVLAVLASHNILEGLNIHGVSKIEDAILAGLLTGDPVLLIGSHGSAKTLLCTRLAEALCLNFQGYDASKALFEDILGFPMPSSLNNGKVEYAPTPISIWGREFVLIDEISRANPSMQNKWLEVIRSRSIMGKKIEGLQYIFAAMNPPSYLGAIPLDVALAGRFAFHLPMPEVKDMNIDDLNKIISEVSNDDAPSWNLSRTNISGPAKENLKQFISSAKLHLPDIVNKYDKKVCDYIAALTSSFKLQKIFLDGRRLGMLRRNLLSLLAVTAIKKSNNDFSENELDLIFSESLLYSLPFEASGEKVYTDLILYSHQIAFQLLTKSSERLRMRTSLFSSQNPVEMTINYIKNADKLEREDNEDFLTFIEDSLKNDEDELHYIDYVICLFFIIKAQQEKKINLLPGISSRIMNLWSDITGVIPDAGVGALGNALKTMLEPANQESKEPVPPFSVNSKQDWLCLRIAYNVIERGNKIIRIKKQNGLSLDLSDKKRVDVKMRDKLIRLYVSTRNKLLQKEKFLKSFNLEEVRL